MISSSACAVVFFITAAAEPDICERGACNSTLGLPNLFLLQREVADYRMILEEMPEVSEEQAVRFLMQASFGASRSSVQELSTMSYSQWIRAQMDVEFDTHRAFYRKRVNPPEGRLHLARLPCEAGSRWHTFAFTKQDKGKRIHV